MTSRSIVKNILFSVFLILLFFGLFEFVSRVVGEKGEPVPEEYLRFTLDSDLLWHFVPEQHVVQPSRGVEYLINSEGLRGADFPAQKPEGEERILIIGDSVSFGFGVTEGKSFPALLRELLREHMPDANLRLINGGVNGYSTREELKFLKGKGIGYDPDMVIICFALNDASIYARQYQLNSFLELQEFKKRRDKLGRVRRVFERLRLVGLISKMVDRLRPGSVSMEELRIQRYLLHKDIMHLESEEALEGWAIAMAELEEMTSFLDDQEVETLITIVPTRFQLEETPTPDEPQRRLEEFCEQRGVLFLDVLPAILEGGGKRLYLDESHLSAEGNEIMAAKIRDLVIADAILDRI